MEDARAESFLMGRRKDCRARQPVASGRVSWSWPKYFLYPKESMWIENAKARPPFALMCFFCIFFKN